MRKSELERKYQTSRLNVLLLIIFSVVNIGTILFNNSYFLFSLTFPRVVFGVIEYLIDQGEIFREQVNYTLVIIVMAIPLILFLLCYIFSSKNRYKGFIWAIILFSIDSLFTILNFDVIDILFHIYIFVLLFLGLRYGLKLKNQDYEDDISYVPSPQAVGNNEFVLSNSSALREDSPKGRKLISTTYNNLEIVVKRHYGLTELIINDKVYDEFKGFVEMSYRLTAVVNSVKVEFVFDGFRMHLLANGVEIVKKVRLF